MSIITFLLLTSIIGVKSNIQKPLDVDPDFGPLAKTTKELTYLQGRSDAFLTMTTKVLQILTDSITESINLINQNGLDIVVEDISKLKALNETLSGRKSELEDTANAISLCARIVDDEVQKLVEDFLDNAEYLYNNAHYGSVMTLGGFVAWNPVTDRLAIERIVDEQFWLMVSRHNEIYPKLHSTVQAILTASCSIRMLVEQCILDGLVKFKNATD